MPSPEPDLAPEEYQRVSACINAVAVRLGFSVIHIRKLALMEKDIRHHLREQSQSARRAAFERCAEIAEDVTCCDGPPHRPRCHAAIAAAIRAEKDRKET